MKSRTADYEDDGPLWAGGAMAAPRCARPGVRSWEQGEQGGGAAPDRQAAQWGEGEERNARNAPTTTLADGQQLGSRQSQLEQLERAFALFGLPTLPQLPRGLRRGYRGREDLERG